MSDYGRQTVIGPLVGFRVFRVYQDKLYGPHRGGAFWARGNVAHHADGVMASWGEQGAAWNRAGRQVNGYPPSSVVGGDPMPTFDCRGISTTNCTCGYYACFNPADVPNPNYSLGTVTAIIGGHGTCTVGDLGFRAEKADLLALIQPPTNALDYLSADYADVPVFSSFMAAVREFPLSEGVAS